MAHTIATPRLLLRPLGAVDADVLVQELNNFSVVRNTARIPHPYHRDDAEDFLRFAASLNSRSLVAAITRKEDPARLLGVVSYEWSDDKGDAELGYWLSPSVWRHGFGTEAARAAVEHAFTVHNLPLLVACYHDDNPASGRILRKLGFEVVGACRSFSKARGMEVPVTNLRLPRLAWENKKAAGT